jgi:ComF family protein
MYLLKALESLFFPNCCAGCGRQLNFAKQSICLNCLSILPDTNFVSQPENPIEKIFTGRLPLAAAYSQFYFTRSSAIQSVIHQLKYKGNKQSGIDMGKLMGLAIKDSGRFSNIDFLIPLPLFPEKEKIRGYNQAEILCQGIAEVLQIPVEKNLVLRTRATATQTHKNRLERWQNVNEVFAIADPQKLEGKKLLLVDDVITTGATLEACGNSILSVCKAELYIASLAFAMQ